MKIRKLETKDLPNLGIHEDDGIRQLRKPLLRNGFDAYKIAFLCGEIEISVEEHEQIKAWAQRLRDKDITALEEIPEKIKYYL